MVHINSAYTLINLARCGFSHGARRLPSDGCITYALPVRVSCARAAGRAGGRIAELELIVEQRPESKMRPRSGSKARDGLRLSSIDKKDEGIYCMPMLVVMQALSVYMDKPLIRKGFGPFVRPP
ncbi:hypothetical protein EVAR_44388_1, partial [Eumeta japonica]